MSFYLLSDGLGFARQHGDEFEPDGVARLVGGVHVARLFAVLGQFPALVVVAQFVFFEGEGEGQLRDRKSVV